MQCLVVWTFREIRPFFNVRELHLGHLAQSFGLKKKPSELAKLLKQQAQSRKMKAANKARVRSPLVACSVVNVSKSSAVTSASSRLIQRTTIGRAYRKGKTKAMETATTTANKGRGSVASRRRIDTKEYDGTQLWMCPSLGVEQR